MIATAQVLATARDAWRGTVLVSFQPGEETAQGARAMTADWDARGLPHADVVPGGTDPARLIRRENAHGAARCAGVCSLPRRPAPGDFPSPDASRSEEHPSDLQSITPISYAPLR